MRIGINLLYLLPGVVGGTETYANGLIFALAELASEHTFLIFTNRESKDWPLPRSPNFVRIECPVSAENRAARYLYEQCVLPRLLARNNADLVHSLGYVGPIFAQCPSIVTVHDLNYRAFGQAMPVRKRFFLGFMIRLSVLMATRVITDSQFSLNEIAKAFSVARSKLEVIHAATNLFPCSEPASWQVQPVHEQYGIAFPYIMAFSSVSPNKNIGRLVEAFKRACVEGGLPHQLVLVGSPPRDIPAATRDNLDRKIQVVGYVDKMTLQALLSNAESLVFPSYYEGFGLPILEAMAAGVPVACSNAASLPEVAGEAALFFDPFSVEQIKTRIIRLALNPDLRAELVRKGYLNLKRFSWGKAARSAVRVYEEVIEAGR